MSEYSHPLGDTVKKARKKMGLTQNQVAIMTDSDERTIMNIENYKPLVPSNGEPVGASDFQ